MPIPNSLPPRRSDPETSSIRSSAPSYTSSTSSILPSYHSSTLPRYSPRDCPRLAIGFRANRHGSVSGLAGGSGVCNISSWTPVSGGCQTRAYHSVARRRATVAAGSSLLPTGPSAFHRHDVDSTASAEIPSGSPEDITRRNLEEQNRREREEEERRKQEGEEVLRQEDKAWDFMLAQMADWEARERSWKRFREEVERGGVLKRRIGGSFG